MSINAGSRLRDAFESPDFIRTYLNKIDEYGETRGVKYAKKLRLTRQTAQALGLDASVTCGILAGLELDRTAFGFVGDFFAKGYDPDFSADRLAVEQMSAVLAAEVEKAAEELWNASFEEASNHEEDPTAAAVTAHSAAREAAAGVAILGHESARILDGLRHALIGADSSAEELLARMMHTAAALFDRYPFQRDRDMSLILYKQGILSLSAKHGTLTEPDIELLSPKRDADRKILVSEALAVLQAAQRIFAEDPERIPKAFRDALFEYDTETMAAIYAVGMSEAALEELVGEENMMAEIKGVTRFYRDQDLDYEQALAEVRAGHKETHWIWYIFPQIRGLGSSESSYYYGIASLDEAKEYLADPLLAGRLVEITQAVLDSPKDPWAIFGGTDAKKVRSCMTLFSLAAEDPEQKALFDAVLEKHYGGKLCEKTLKVLNGEDPWQK